MHIYVPITILPDQKVWRLYPRHIEKGDESRYNLWYTNQRGIQKALDLKRGCMAKSLLHKELQMFPDVPVRKEDQDSKYS